MKYQKIGVYLSSKADLPESYTEAAQKVGELIGRTGRTLVYGGARKGLMETLAQSVKANGGRVFGMVPDIIVARGLESEAVDVTFRCVDLTDRKAMMNRESDVLVALPGGIGTLDEVFTVLANSAIGIERKPVIFLNIDGCWNKLLEAVDDLCRQGLVSEKPGQLFQVADSVEELAEML